MRRFEIAPRCSVQCKLSRGTRHRKMEPSQEEGLAPAVSRIPPTAGTSPLPDLFFSLRDNSCDVSRLRRVVACSANCREAQGTAKWNQVRKTGLPRCFQNSTQQRGQAPLPDLFFSLRDNTCDVSRLRRGACS